MSASATEVFCRQVRARSAEHVEAAGLLIALPGQVVSLLRQELDSLVRVIYLLSIADRNERDHLVAQSVAGKRWTHSGSRRRVTDREMVDLAGRLHGWTHSVYSFGCAFIHLSGLHDYRTRDPLGLLPDDERESLLAHLRYYHGGPVSPEPTFDDIIPYLPSALRKVTGNLECYLRDLEEGKDDSLDPL